MWLAYGKQMNFPLFDRMQGLCIHIYTMVFMLIGFSALAQDEEQPFTMHNIIDSTVVLHRDARLDSLVLRHRRVNAMKDGFPGYRLQLYSGSGTAARQEANQLRADFMARNPDVPAYLTYQAPNFKVRVGDFRTELEAIKLQRELEYQWPGAFVVRDLIKFPKLAIEQEQVLEGVLEEDSSEGDSSPSTDEEENMKE